MMMVFIFGSQLHIQNFQKVLFQLSTVINKTSYWIIWPHYDANTVHAFADLDWATCLKTRCSFGGTVLRLAGGTIAYKSKFQPMVAGSSTEAEFMAAYKTGKMILFVRSVI
jgi:hypothetical protein